MSASGFHPTLKLLSRGRRRMGSLPVARPDPRMRNDTDLRDTEGTHGPRPTRRYERPALRPVQRGRWHALQLIHVLVDLVALAAALLGATAIRFGGAAVADEGSYGIGLILWLVLWLGGLVAVGLYDLE